MLTTDQLLYQTDSHGLSLMEAAVASLYKVPCPLPGHHITSQHEGSHCFRCTLWLSLLPLVLTPTMAATLASAATMVSISVMRNPLFSAPTATAMCSPVPLVPATLAMEVTAMVASMTTGISVM